MTNSNNSKSSNSNQQEQQQQYNIDFINEKWELEEKCFTDTLMPPVKIQDRDTKRSRWVRKSFPRVKPIEQRGFESFYSKIIDPQTGKPYEQRDSSGAILKQSDGLPAARHIVHTIVRLLLFMFLFEIYILVHRGFRVMTSNKKDKRKIRSRNTTLFIQPFQEDDLYYDF